MAKRMNVTPADREAWIEYEDYDGAFADRIRTGSEDSTSGLQMFARYAEDARIAEREACAMVAEAYGGDYESTTSPVCWTRRNIAAAIRARS